MIDLDFHQDTFSLEHGRCIFQYPRKVSAADLADMKEWLAIVLRHIERNAVVANTESSAPEREAK